MRIHLKTSSSKEIIPFNYQPGLTGALHKWIGFNDLHDELSLYSFSWLRGSSTTKGGLTFNKNGYFFISAHDSELIKKVISGIQNHPEIGYGLYVNEIIIQENPVFNTGQMFYTASPIFIKRNQDNRTHHFEYNETGANNCLTETLRNKLEKAELNAEGISVSFDTSYPKAKTKVIHYQDIGNKVNICPVFIEGTPEQIAFAWNVGLGNSTGIGFGAIK
nr:CRISPR-associated endoribonuclease Cas6 [Bacteroidota bacterium]